MLERFYGNFVLTDDELALYDAALMVRKGIPLRIVLDSNSSVNIHDLARLVEEMKERDDIFMKMEERYDV